MINRKQHFSDELLASLRCVDKLKKLVEDEGAVKAVNEAGKTLLHFSAGWGHTEAVKFLIKTGIDVNLKDNRGDTPLHKAAHNGHIEITETLLKAGAKVNVSDMYFWTPLHEAVYENRIELVKILIAAGADVNAKTDDGRTVLQMAGRYPEVAKILREVEQEVVG